MVLWWGCEALLGVDARRVAGYEYNYRFSIDDEMAPFYKFEFLHGTKTHIFEIRTSFIMKKINGQDQIMDSERFHAIVYGDSQTCLMGCVADRFAEYWMTNDEIGIFVREALDFAAQTGKNTSRLLIPIVVHIDVCTVQQENETVDSVSDRVIREEKLVPFDVWPFNPAAADRGNLDGQLWDYLARLMMGWPGCGELDSSNIRVEDVGEGMTVMPICNICSRGPMIGTRISVLPSCNHAFHLHCIVRRMLGKNYMCPTCQVPAYPYQYPPLLET
ncbi:hypothetical protein ABFS82_14G149200 [Erythranthe guttata]